jgi:Tol biopolymer transport system component
VTSFSGNEDQAAFSPDGKQIAFVWNGDKEDNSDIYVKMIGAEKPLRLTSNPAPDTDPTWSPDARYIAFLRQSADDGGVFLVPSLGGAERKLADVFPYRPVVIGNTLAIRQTASCLRLLTRTYSSSPSASSRSRLKQVRRPNSLHRRRDPSVISFPAFSPDQKTLAFVRSVSIAAADIYSAFPYWWSSRHGLTF